MVSPYSFGEKARISQYNLMVAPYLVESDNFSVPIDEKANVSRYR